jgi:NAD(P) transhydrogenase subunit alpha
MMGPVALLTVVVLAVFVGFEVVSKVTSKLHTPLMSGANAIHGIILVGAIIVAGQASDPWVLCIALLAVVLATVNLVGGFVVTDRMLEMFSAHKRARTPARTVAPAAGGTAAEGHTGDGHARDGSAGAAGEGR